MRYQPKQPGFTLAELLIALAILGVIATFTIPKILDSNTGNKYNAMAKESAGMISGALQNYKLNGSQVIASTSGGDFTPYMNYVGLETVEGVDGNSDTCVYFNNSCANGSGNICLRLHNGAILRYNSADSFGSTANTAAIYFHFDADGRTSGSGDLNGRGLYLILYQNGKVRTKNSVEPNTQSAIFTLSPIAGCDPPWFSWSN